MNTVGGVNFANAKRFCEYVFEEHLFKMAKNDVESTYEVYLDKKADKKEIEKFRKKFPAFTIIFVTIEQ